MSDPALDGVSHVMIDEGHERDIDTDYLLVLLKELLTKRLELRVIVMSATLDAESFGNYFSQGRETKSTKSVPVMSVPAKPFHPVEILYLEDMAGESNKIDDDDFPRQLQALAETLLEAHDQQLQLDLDEAHAEEKASAGLEARSHAEDEGEILGSSDSKSESDYDSDSDSDDEKPLTRAEILRRAVSIRNEATGDCLKITGAVERWLLNEKLVKLQSAWLPKLPRMWWNRRQPPDERGASCVFFLGGMRSRQQ
jgi:HrpA-like RNA helicase